MTDDERARELWELGTKRLSEGQVEEAVKLFEQSIAVKPTAEGHTFRGWALSHDGHLDEAIEDCKQAIQLDPDFGNPYNDIGVYLMQKRHFNEAIPWLERAKLAFASCCSRHPQKRKSLLNRISFLDVPAAQR